MSGDFNFLDPGTVEDEELQLVLILTTTDERGMNGCPCYYFRMQSPRTGQIMGQLRLRIGDGEGELKYLGHIGYDVDEKHRGNRLAARSVGLILPFAAKHGLDAVWINCDNENIASCRTCEILGAVHIETVEVPEDDVVHEDGIRQLSRYQLKL